MPICQGSWQVITLSSSTTSSKLRTQSLIGADVGTKYDVLSTDGINIEQPGRVVHGLSQGTWITYLGT